MDASKKQTDFYEKNLLSFISKSREEFIKEYRKCEKTKAKDLYIQILSELKEALSIGNINSFKNWSRLIDYISNIENAIALGASYDNTDNHIKNTNLVILACKYNQVKILEFLFVNDSKILTNLSIDIGKTTILPNNEDEDCHNAFYYAIRSGNIELLDTLVTKWPDNYFDSHSEELDDILASTYEELKLKNVELSEAMQVFVEHMMINLRFFKTTTVLEGIDKLIEKRLILILENIKFLKFEYSDTKRVDEKFLFVCRFIAKNIFFLKRQLKSTYNRLPWEEIEFCLVSSVSSHTKLKEINLFYRSVLNKEKILNYLENFAKTLEYAIGSNVIEMNTSKLTEFPKSKREEVVTDIISNCPLFERLYNDYELIKDVYSLEKISEYIELALLVDTEEKEGQLVIIRALQVIGEYLKNTLESPNLSSATSELLLLSAPKNTKEIITGLCNSLSHSYSLSKRTEIEENVDVRFFTNIQNDLKKISIIITDTLYNNKIKMLRILLNKIVNSGSLNEIKEIVDALHSVEFNKMISENIKTSELEKIEELIKELNDKINEKTNYEKELFNKITNIINFEKAKLTNIKTDYLVGFSALKTFSIQVENYKIIDDNSVRVIKILANTTLGNISPKTESKTIKEIVKLSIKISNSVRPRMQHENFNDVNMLIHRIFCIAEFETGQIKWIGELRKELNENKYKQASFICEQKQKTYTASEERYSDQLTLKLSTLKSILSSNALSNNQLIEKFLSYKSNKKLQAVIEMLVLDILSILASSKNYLANNIFLEDNSPLLIGKCLHNYLAHGNALIDVLLFDPSIAVVSNAIKLTEENLMKNSKKNGNSMKDDPSKLKDRYDQGLVTIDNQVKMFIALEEGSLENLKSCVKKGADTNARNSNLWTTLHFAAKGPSLEVVKFILDQNLSINVKDVNGKNPLHIAAFYGRTSIVEFFVEETGLHVDDIDKYRRTAIHMAALNGHKDTIEVLLKNNANINIKSVFGFLPLHDAVQNNHKDVVEILIEKEANVDSYETIGGFTSLHLAAENGYLELVEFLIKIKANVNAKNDKDFIPLHTAALNGHLEVVKALIIKGSNVNAKIFNDCTPLHYAVEYGHEKIVKLLLEHGVNVNVADQTYNNMPLHMAAKDGYKEIVEALLKNGADVHAINFKGKTPLHLAAESGHKDVVDLLIKNKALVNIKDNNCCTALHLSAQNGHNDVARFLLKKGAESNVRDENNWTPLHVAARHGSKEVVDTLIAEGDINTMGGDGLTALHLSILNSHLDIVEVLVEKGAKVNATGKNNLISLHLAALSSGNDKIVKFLLKKGTNVNTKDMTGSTPLHLAALIGNQAIVEALIERRAEVNIKNMEGYTPLHLAVQGNHREVTNALIEKGANINIGDNSSFTPLCYAVKHNYEEIMEVLVDKGANVNAEGGQPLLLATFAGNENIVETLLKNKNININVQNPGNSTLLHIAAANGHKGIVDTLIVKGSNVNARSSDGVTPLHIAAMHGHSDVIEILLNSGANISIRDNRNRTSIELAVASDHLQVVKTLLQHKDVNADGNDNWPVLHIAAQKGYLEITKYLINAGADINVKNNLGSKSIHIAAREGHKNIVEFFLNNGLSINDLGAGDWTLLHYAAVQGRLEVAKYLIGQNVDVNAVDCNGSSPVHIAAGGGYKDVIEVLLNNGAIYNSVDKFNRMPLEVANNKDVIKLLASTEKLFRAVKHNCPLEVENFIKEGAFVNAKNTDSVTTLHYATWKGYKNVVNILLTNKANPNAVSKGGSTPLHYASKFNRFEIVKALLTNGAIYNVVTDYGKTPLDFAMHQNIINLLKLVNESFKNVENCYSKISNDLKKVKDIDVVKAIMNARNRESKTLIVAAIQNDFLKTEELKQVLQDDVSARIDRAIILLEQEKYLESLNIFMKILEKRKEIFGPDNPSTLDIHIYIAKVLYKQRNFQEALNIAEEIYGKQKEILGFNSKDTLSTRSFIALLLHRLGKNQEALNLYKEIYQKQREILGPSHSDTLDSQFYMAVALDKREKYEEALSNYYEVLEKRIEMLGKRHPAILSIQNNIAMVFNNQNKHEEALKIYQNVYETRKKILGPGHSDTLRTLHNIATVFSQQGKQEESLKAYQEVFGIQKAFLGPSHFDTLTTQCNMANVLFSQGKIIGALKAYTEGFDQRKAVLGPDHPDILDTLKKIELINFGFKLEGNKVPNNLKHIQLSINIAASNGDVKIVEELLESGVDVDTKDTDGRTPLHYAANNGHKSIVNILLKNRADATKVTNKGNTPLHTATSKGYKEIVEVLLQHVEQACPDEFTNFINAKTSAGGTTSLHVAAKIGSLEIVICLLKHGAIYNATDKNTKTPLDYSINQNVTDILKLVEQLFECAKKGDSKIISRLKTIKPGQLAAIANARNCQEKTSVQVALFCKHKDIASSLIKILQENKCTQSASK